VAHALEECIGEAGPESVDPRFQRLDADKEQIQEYDHQNGSGPPGAVVTP
jgi:hypothetical protein